MTQDKYIDYSKAVITAIKGELKRLNILTNRNFSIAVKEFEDSIIIKDDVVFCLAKTLQKINDNLKRNIYNTSDEVSDEYLSKASEIISSLDMFCVASDLYIENKRRVFFINVD